jgi:hypothetical protein
MNENRRKILDMLGQGQINADEADRLIGALEKEQEPAKARPKYLRVLVDSEEDSKVNIRVPMQFLRAGVKLANLIPVHARLHVNDALHKQGIALDVGQLNSQTLEELVDQLDDITIDVDEKNHKAKVRVFCE